jgi:hypothetical protein
VCLTRDEGKTIMAITIKKVERYEETIVEIDKKRLIRLRIDDKTVLIPIDDDIYAYFNQQFVRPKPSALQKQKYTTIMNLLRAAYFKGLDDGKNGAR